MSKNDFIPKFAEETDKFYKIHPSKNDGKQNWHPWFGKNIFLSTNFTFTKFPNKKDLSVRNIQENS